MVCTHHHHHFVPPDEARGLVRLACRAALGVAFFLVAIKILAWYWSGSLSLKASLIDSVFDGIASLINYIAVTHAHKPADHEHRFGHGKLEALTAIAQSLVVSISAFFVLHEAVERFFDPQPLVKTTFALGVMVVATVATLGLVLLQNFVMKRTNSLAVAADSAHYRIDVLMNIGVIVSIFLAQWFQIYRADALFAAGITFYIVHAAWGISRRAVNVLMDHELPEDERREIIEVAEDHPEVHGVHRLRTRSSGVHRFIYLHLGLDGQIDLNHAHRISHEVEERLLAVFPNAEVIVHEEPYLHDAHPLNPLQLRPDVPPEKKTGCSP